MVAIIDASLYILIGFFVGFMYGCALSDEKNKNGDGK